MHGLRAKWCRPLKGKISPKGIRNLNATNLEKSTRVCMRSKLVPVPLFSLNCLQRADRWAEDPFAGRFHPLQKALSDIFNWFVQGLVPFGVESKVSMALSTLWARLDLQTGYPEHAIPQKTSAFDIHIHIPPTTPIPLPLAAFLDTISTCFTVRTMCSLPFSS